MTTHARRELADAIDDFNADWREEIASQRNADHHLIYDDRPSAAELAADEWDMPPSLGPDPWADDPAPTPRVLSPLPDAPPF